MFDTQRQFEDWRKPITGRDGRCFLTMPDGTDRLFGQVSGYSLKGNLSGQDYQPLFDPLIHSIPTGMTITLTIDEFFTTDDFVMETFWEQFKQIRYPIFNFKLIQERTFDGQQRIIYVNGCTVVDEIDFITISSSDIVKRNWQFRVNEVPTFGAYFND